MLPLFFDQEQAPYLHKAVTYPDFWAHQGNIVIERNKDLESLPPKVMRKVFKVFCLAQINGSGLRNKIPINVQLDEKRDGAGRDCIIYADKLRDVLAINPAAIEFNSLSKQLHKGGFKE